MEDVCVVCSREFETVGVLPAYYYTERDIEALEETLRKADTSDKDTLSAKIELRKRQLEYQKKVLADDIKKHGEAAARVKAAMPAVEAVLQFLDKFSLQAIWVDDTLFYTNPYVQFNHYRRYGPFTAAYIEGLEKEYTKLADESKAQFAWLSETAASFTHLALYMIRDSISFEKDIESGEKLVARVKAYKISVDNDVKYKKVRSITNLGSFSPSFVSDINAGHTRNPTPHLARLYKFVDYSESLEAQLYIEILLENGEFAYDIVAKLYSLYADYVENFKTDMTAFLQEKSNNPAVFRNHDSFRNEISRKNDQLKAEFAEFSALWADDVARYQQQ